MSSDSDYARELAAMTVGAALERFRSAAESATVFRTLQPANETAQHTAAIADAALRNVLEKLEFARITGCGEAFASYVHVLINEIVQGGLAPGGSA